MTANHVETLSAVSIAATTIWFFITAVIAVARVLAQAERRALVEKFIRTWTLPPDVFDRLEVISTERKAWLEARWLKVRARQMLDENDEQLNIERGARRAAAGCSARWPT